MTTANDQIVQESSSDWRKAYLARYYSGARAFSDQWPRVVRTHTPPGARALEIGGGPVQWTTEMLRERASEIVGLDIDPLVRTNPLLNQAFVYDGNRFPLPNDRFEFAISRWVNEHLPDPLSHFQEVQRVLVPGGLYVFRTVNLWHYKTIGVWLAPRSLHGSIVRWLSHMPKDEHDPYPTHYRANTRRRIVALCEKAGLEILSIEATEGYPTYGLASKALFRAFMAYERLVNSSHRFERFRHTLDVIVRKPQR